MSSTTPDPYTPPRTPSESAAKTRWRVFPAAGSFAIGLASLLFLLTTTALLAQETSGPVINTVAVYALYLGFGGSWILAGWCYWRRRFWYGLAANCIGVLVVVTVYEMFGR